jgi:26S proteasome regulatory subunit N13
VRTESLAIQFVLFTWGRILSGPSRPAQQATTEQVESLRRLLSSYRAGGAAAASAPPGEEGQKRLQWFTDPNASEYSLTDILTPANITPLFTSHPELVPTLFPHLPSDLPNPPNAETVTQIIASPQFRSAVSNLDQALRTGLLGGFVRSLGLPEEAGTSVESFLKAIQDQAASEDSMQTD